jgi:opacity protein-like surface antigen
MVHLLASNKILVTLLFTSAALSASAAAIAQDDDDQSADNFTAKSRLMGNLGIGSVVGFIGGTYTYAPVPQFQLELGSGIGWSGFQFSMMPKLSLGDDRHCFVMGVGPSLAVDPDNNPPHTYVALWLNAEVGYEYRSVGGFSFLIAAGIVRGLAGEVRDQCVIDCEGDTKGWSRPAPEYNFPQMRIAFGRWF